MKVSFGPLILEKNKAVSVDTFFCIFYGMICYINVIWEGVSRYQTETHFQERQR